MSTLKHNLKHVPKRIRRIIGRPQADTSITGKVGLLINSYSLPFAIVSAIAAALLLTIVSVLLYSISGTAKLDLSRPGYESALKQVHRSDSNNQNFSASGALDGKVINDFLKLYDKEAKDVSQYSSFKENILDDAQLGLTAEQAPASDGASTQP